MEMSKKMVSKKPQKRSVEYLLENASDETIRKLIDQDGLISDMKPSDMKKLLGITSGRLPRPSEYTAE